MPKQSTTAKLMLLFLASQAFKNTFVQAKSVPYVIKYSTSADDPNDVYPLVLNLLDGSLKKHVSDLFEMILNTIEDVPAFEKYLRYTDWQFNIVLRDDFAPHEADDRQLPVSRQIRFRDQQRVIDISTAFFMAIKDSYLEIDEAKIGSLLLEMMMRDIQVRPTVNIEYTDGSQGKVGPQYDQSVLSHNIDIIFNRFDALYKLVEKSVREYNPLLLKSQYTSTKTYITLDMLRNIMDQMIALNQLKQSALQDKGPKWTALRLCSDLFFDVLELQPLQSFNLVKDIKSAFQTIVSTYVNGLVNAKLQINNPTLHEPKITFSYENNAPHVDANNPAHSNVNSYHHPNLWAQQEKQAKYAQRQQQRDDQKHMRQQMKNQRYHR